MFRKSQSSSAPDLFSNFESHFKDRKQNQLNDENGWHNVFYGHITSKVDEVSGVSRTLCKRSFLFYNKRTRSPNIMTNRLSAACQLNMGRDHFFAMLRRAR